MSPMIAASCVRHTARKLAVDATVLDIDNEQRIISVQFISPHFECFNMVERIRLLTMQYQKLAPMLTSRYHLMFEAYTPNELTEQYKKFSKG